MLVAFAPFLRHSIAQCISCLDEAHGFGWGPNPPLQLVRAGRSSPATPGRLISEPGLQRLGLTCICMMHSHMHADDGDSRRRSGC